MSPHLHPEPTEPKASNDPIATAKEEAARLRALRAEVKTTEYRLGTALHLIKERQLFVRAGCANFAAFVADLRLSTKDADWYIATRNIPAEFLAGRRIATGKLSLISDAPEWLRGPLCANVDTDISQKAVRDAIREARKVRDRGASTAEATAVAVRVLAEHRQKNSQGERTLAENAQAMKRQMAGLLREIGRWRARTEEGGDELLVGLESMGQDLADALVALGLARPKTVTKFFTKIIAVPAAPGEVKNCNQDATPISGNPEEQTTRAAGTADDDGEDDDEGEDDLWEDEDAGEDEDDEDDGEDHDDHAADDADPPMQYAPPPAPAPWPPPAATCAAEELVKTAAQAGDEDAPANPAALAQLRRVPTISFEGQEYPLALIRDAFVACLHETDRARLNDGLGLLMGAHSDLEAHEAGKQHLHGLAFVAQVQGAEQLPPGVPRGLLRTWAERCTQPDPAARMPYCLHSLLTFRFDGFHRCASVLRRDRAQQPYRTLFADAARLCERDKDREDAKEQT